MALLAQKQLDYVAAQRIKLYRPSKFRRIVPIDSTVPTWADRVEHSQIEMKGEDPVPIPRHGPVKDLPRPSISREAGYISIKVFGYAYGYSDDELDRAAIQKVNLPATYAVANQQNTERFFDKIAAGQLYSSLGLPGLLNNASVTVYTACTKAAGGTTWAKATWAELIADVSYLITSIYTQTLENRECNLVIMASASWLLLTRTLHPTTNASAMSMLRSMFPGVRFEVWEKLALADAAGTGPRVVAMVSDEAVARMIIPRELTDDTPIREPFGWNVPQKCSTAGVLVEDTSAISYLDGV